jgi:hypothetical protein
MDVEKTINELRSERAKVIHAIGVLESLHQHGPGVRIVSGDGPSEGSRRGRKSMSEEERRAVSERMRQYWARRRQNLANPAPPAAEPAMNRTARQARSGIEYELPTYCLQCGARLMGIATVHGPDCRIPRGFRRTFGNDPD